MKTNHQRDFKIPNKENENIVTRALLDSNEGDSDESDPMKRVAVWLRELASESQDDIIVKQLAKETGATISRAREFWHNRKISHACQEGRPGSF